MKLHANARLSVKGRELLVDRVEDAGWSVMQAAEAAGITERTAHKWLARYRVEGAPGLLDRSSAPLRVANRTEERCVEAIAALRRLRMTGAEIGEVLGMALSTVSAPTGEIERRQAASAGTVARCGRAARGGGPSSRRGAGDASRGRGEGNGRAGRRRPTTRSLGWPCRIADWAPGMRSERRA